MIQQGPLLKSPYMTQDCISFSSVLVSDTVFKHFLFVLMVFLNVCILWLSLYLDDPCNEAWQGRAPWTHMSPDSYECSPSHLSKGCVPMLPSSAKWWPLVDSLRKCELVLLMLLRVFIRDQKSAELCSKRKLSCIFWKLNGEKDKSCWFPLNPVFIVSHFYYQQFLVLQILIVFGPPWFCIARGSILFLLVISQFSYFKPVSSPFIYNCISRALVCTGTLGTALYLESMWNWGMLE